MRNTEFLQTDKLPSEPIPSQRPNPFKQHLPAHAGLWVPSHAFRRARLAEGESPGNGSAPRSPRRTKASAHGRQQSGAGRGCGERHTTKGRCSNDQCSCHRLSHPGLARHRAIHHRPVSPPRRAHRYPPRQNNPDPAARSSILLHAWRSILRPALLKSGEHLLILIMILPMT